jgi:leader peptidase (prepilin peptidase) / N-methyltransferase
MYFNDVHIFWYVAFGLLGLLLGQLVDWSNKRLPEYKKFFSKEFFKNKPNYLLMIIGAILNIGLVYRFGIKNEFIQNLDLIKFTVLVPMLISALMIDYKLQIIPNRLNLTMFEIGLIFAFISGIININVGISMLLGMFAGGGLFLLITLIGGLIAGKEAMGFGDVKLMGALGLFFGFPTILVISVIAFLLGAIISVFVLVTRIKKTDEYIPFGPFIVMACLISIFVPTINLIYILLKILR